jgi:hypothetical protein
MEVKFLLRLEMLFKFAEIKSECVLTKLNVYSGDGRMCDDAEKWRERWLRFQFENFRLCKSLSLETCLVQHCAGLEVSTAVAMKKRFLDCNTL